MWERERENWNIWTFFAHWLKSGHAKDTPVPNVETSHHCLPNLSLSLPSSSSQTLSFKLCNHQHHEHHRQEQKYNHHYYCCFTFKIMMMLINISIKNIFIIRFCQVTNCILDQAEIDFCWSLLMYRHMLPLQRY